MKVQLLAAAVGLSLIAGVANAATTTFDFSAPIATSATEAPNTWYTDRYAPATFQSQVTYGGRTDTLAEGTSVADGASNRPAGYSSSFYNTQGRAYDVAPGTTLMAIDLYIDPLYASASDGQRLAGFWGVGLDGSSQVSSYPIIELDKIGSDLMLRGWDSSGAGSWFNLTTLPTDLTLGSWDNLRIALDGSNIDYLVDGALAGSVDAGGTVSLKSVILQTYNTADGVADTAHWSAGAVPEPAAWAMMILGFGAIGLALRRRQTVQVA